MRAICTRIGHVGESDLRFDIWEFAASETRVDCRPLCFSASYAIFDDGILYSAYYHPKAAEIVTPNEFKRRVKAACGKGE